MNQTQAQIDAAAIVRLAKIIEVLDQRIQKLETFLKQTTGFMPSDITAAEPIHNHVMNGRCIACDRIEDAKE